MCVNTATTRGKTSKLQYKHVFRELNFECTQAIVKSYLSKREGTMEITKMLNDIDHDNHHFLELEVYEWVNDDDINSVTNDDVDNETDKDGNNDDGD